MATITTIQSTDVIANSRTDINNNFANLNSDKIETSYLDTDTSLTANSDSKIPTQKAIKAYVDAGGNPNASTTQKGIVEESTQAELTAGTQTGATGARLFLNPVHTVSTSAGASDEGKIPKLNSSGLLDSTILGTATKKTYSVVENMDGTTTPVAVCINTAGNVQKAEADQTGTFDKFIGFCTSAITTAETNFINTGQAFTTTLAFVANAGVNRVVFVHVAMFGSPSFTAPSSVTYGGSAMTLIQTSTNGTVNFSGTYYYIIGTNVSNDASVNIVAVGASAAVIKIEACCYSYVNQSTPVGIKAVSSGASSTPNTTIDPTATFSRIVQCVSGGGTSITANSGQSKRTTDGGYGYATLDVQNKTGASSGYQVTLSSSQSWASQAFEIVTSTAPTASITYSGVATFAGLTPNAKYYLSNTAGEIGTSAGSTSVLLGKALSATELFIIQN